MAKKAKESEITAAEATRQSWKELGKNAQGTEVAKHVKSKYGHDVPSSTVSMAKKTVFGTTGRVKRKSSGAVSASGLPTEQKSKTDVVRELMASGLDMPKEIAAAAKKLGVLITPNHVSMIKGKLRKAGAKTKKARTAVSAAPMAGAAAKSPVVVAAARVTAPASNLELENAALKLALKAGSVQAAIQALGRLE